MATTVLNNGNIHKAHLNMVLRITPASGSDDHTLAFIKDGTLDIQEGLASDTLLRIGGSVGGNGNIIPGGKQEGSASLQIYRSAALPALLAVLKPGPDANGKGQYPTVTIEVYPTSTSTGGPSYSFGPAVLTSPLPSTFAESNNATDTDMVTLNWTIPDGRVTESTWGS